MEPAHKVISQWRLAGWITAFFSILQMAFFAALMVQLSPIVATNNYWGLILSFSITGVVAAVCMSRVVRLRKVRP